MGALEPYRELESRYTSWLRETHPHVVACSSGTAALHLALEALRLQPGSRVVVPDFTMVACARAVVLSEHVPQFADCLPNLTLDPAELAMIRHNAVMAVHIYGRLCDMDAIHREAEGPVVEDMAEAHGLRPHPNTAAACWSFYKNKIVAGEEGGLVAFRDPHHADLARSLRSLGFTEEHNFMHIPRGHNYRMSNLHASAVLTSWEQMRVNISNRFRVLDLYDKLVPDEWKMPPRQSPWVYDLRLPEVSGVDHVVRELHKLGVAGARCGFKCMREQPEFKTWLGDLGMPLEGTRAYEASRSVMYLPVTPDMTCVDVERHVDALKSVVRMFL